MADNSFDIVSKVEMPEVNNAISQALKDVGARYDLKDAKSSIELKEKDHKILLASADEYKLGAVVDILQSKLNKRGISLKALTYGPVQPASEWGRQWAARATSLPVIRIPISLVFTAVTLTLARPMSGM